MYTNYSCVSSGDVLSARSPQPQFDRLRTANGHLKDELDDEIYWQVYSYFVFSNDCRCRGV